jgi:hypothetical protein
MNFSIIRSANGYVKLSNTVRNFIYNARGIKPIVSVEEVTYLINEKINLAEDKVTEKQVYAALQLIARTNKNDELFNDMGNVIVKNIDGFFYEVTRYGK